MSVQKKGRVFQKNYKILRRILEKSIFFQIFDNENF